jgi:hypothetical protein
MQFFQLELFGYCRLLRESFSLGYHRYLLWILFRFSGSIQLLHSGSTTPDRSPAIRPARRAGRPAVTPYALRVGGFPSLGNNPPVPRR